MAEDVYSLEPVDQDGEDQRPLVQVPAPAAATIDDDRVCGGCGYNLRGLRQDGRCPECGASIAGSMVRPRGRVETKLERMIAGLTGLEPPTASSPLPEPTCAVCGQSLCGLRAPGRCPGCGTTFRRTRYNDADMVQMPATLIRQFRLGAWLAASATWGYLVLWIVSRVATLPALAPPVAKACLAVVWVLGAWLLTPGTTSPAAIRRGLGPRSALRQTARWMQIGWAIGALGGAVPILAGLGSVAGLVGMVALLIVLSRQAEWTGDDFAQRCFGYALWGAVTGWTLILFVTYVGFPRGSGIILVPLFLIVGLLLLAGTILALPLGLFSLARSLDWCVTYQAQRLAGNERLVQQQAGKGRASGIDPATSIAHDRHCAGCGYNLRGLPLAGRCPECGWAVLG